MADLKACFEEMGFSEVKTWLQTGNVTFEAAETDTTLLKQQIETTLTQTFSYPAKVQVYTTTQLKKITDAYPFDEVEGKHAYVVLLEDGLEHTLSSEATGLDPAQEQIQVGQGVIYWQVDKGSTLKSAFAKNLNKTKYKNFNTNRNLNTLRKIII
jgi:uncharacterized protein (DUF1697 family)